MSKEQPTLFPELVPFQARPPKQSYVSFVPGVKPEEACLEIETWDELIARMVECKRCGLRAGYRQVVVGDGDPEADLMLVGEGPGQDEDQQGLPFVGRAGQLLDRILQAASLRRDEVYITNVVKCRPPGNRLPNPGEVAACRGYLDAQIRLIQPKILVCLGLLATRTVIDEKASMGRARGKWFTRQGVSIIATYHPAALLRRQEYKRPTWEDFKSIRDRYQNLRRGEQSDF